MRIPAETSRAFATMSFVQALSVVGVHAFSSDGEEGMIKIISSVLSLICAVAVPWFFFSAGFWVAGHIGENGWYWREVRKRITTLLVPFWIWSGIYFLFYVVIALMIRLCNYSYNGEDALRLLSVGGLIRVLGFDYRATLPVVWFLRSLFVLFLFLPTLWKFKFFVLPVSIIGYLLLPIVDDSYYVIHSLFSNEGLLSLRGLVYFELGLVIRRFLYGNAKPLKLIVLVSLVIVIIAMPYCVLLGVGDGLARSIVIPPLMYLIYLLCKRYPIPLSITALSFPIYVIHIMPVFVITGVYGLCGIGGVGNIDFTEGLIRWSCSVVLSMLICLIMRRLMPRASGIMFGGR